MKLEWCKSWGEYFCAIKDNEIFSVAGCHPLPEVSPNGWRVFFRRCELPKQSPYKGLVKGPGQMGKNFMNVFLNYCSSDELYITTNIINENLNDMVRHHRKMELVAGHKDGYIDKAGDMILYNTKQTVWKINVKKFYAD